MPSGSVDPKEEGVLPALLALRTEKDFKELLSIRPELLDEAAVAMVLEFDDLPGYGTVLRALASLLREGRNDTATAWARYDRAMQASKDPDGVLKAEVEKAQVAFAAGRNKEALALIDAAGERADSIGDGPLWAALQGLRGRVTLGLDGDRDDLQESALHCFVVAASLSSKNPQTAAIIDLADVSIGRVREDPTENVEHGLALMRLVMRELNDGAPAWLRARARQVLIKALLKQERGDQVALLREALALANEEAATATGAQWASAELNRGEALAGLDEVDREEAENVFRSLLASDVDDPILGAADLALGCLLRKRTDLSWEDEYMEEAEVPAYIGVGGVDNRPILTEARMHLERACERLGDGSHGLEHGMALDELAEVLTRLEESDRAVEINREALAILRPTSLPEASAISAGRLAMALGHRNDWAGSAAAFRDAVEASELLYHRRLDPEARAHEAAKSVSLGRWASFAVAAAGDAQAAALILESSRARQLRRRIAPESSGSANLDEEARIAYQRALEALRASPLRGGGSQATYELHRVLAEIRRSEGFEDFARGAQLEDFADAAICKEPLVYVNPTPFGTQLLLVERNGEEIKFDNFIATPTSQEILRRLLIGDLSVEDVIEEQPIDASYMAGISIYDDDEQMDEDTEIRRIEQLQLGLEEILPWLGRTLGQPLAAALRAGSAQAMTLVPCGVIAHAPLEGILLDNQLDSTLVDEFTVSFAPSALLAGESQRRALRPLPEPPHLLALADPTEDLPAAVAEVQEVAEHFGTNAEVAIGPQADAGFLTRGTASADFIHIAGHGQANLDPAKTGVILADGLFEAAELGGADLQARLVVVSACQSATADTVRNPEELFSVGTALLAAGAAAVIASLWPVDSEATALLMSKLYEEIMVVRQRPPAALRQAQIWLRELSEHDRAEFLSKHPLLASGLRSHRRLTARRSMGTGSLQENAQPFSHPDFWASFIAIGA